MINLVENRFPALTIRTKECITGYVDNVLSASDCEDVVIQWIIDQIFYTNRSLIMWS